MIRAFVAITLPDAMTAALVAAQVGLPAGRQVEPAAMHLTLAFLGEHPEPVVEDAHYALAAIRARRFALRLAGLGLLGDRKPRALVADVAPEPHLSALRLQVARAMRDAGVELGRTRYRPHVTLGRFNAGLAGEEAERMRAFAARGAGFRAGPYGVDAFALMRSRLGRAGPVYDALAIYSLYGTASEVADLS